LHRCVGSATKHRSEDGTQRGENGDHGERNQDLVAQRVGHGSGRVRIGRHDPPPPAKSDIVVTSARRCSKRVKIPNPRRTIESAAARGTVTSPTIV